MAFFDRISRLVKATVNDKITKRQDPEQQLEEIVAKLQVDLVNLRQAVAESIALQKRTDRQRHQANLQAESWYKKAQLAVSKGNEDVGHDALTRRRAYQLTATAMGEQQKEQLKLVANLKQNMRQLESKVIDLKNKKDIYIARARSAQATLKLSDLLDSSGTSEVLQAFERMEDKVLNLEAQAELAQDMSDNQLEKRFEALGEAEEIDAELAELKRSLQK
ncbi:MAG: PspA/IM30 family protein [Cyanobacteria bacterium]|nr:PspA/IM30 family protein [Cyanobacteriota bacterium]